MELLCRRGTEKSPCILGRLNGKDIGRVGTSKSPCILGSLNGKYEEYDEKFPGS